MSADGGPPKQFILSLDDELIVDLFAGGGGMSTAIEEAFGRHADIAVNHNDNALSMHRANHPQTRHFIADVFEIDPRAATRGRRVGHLHLSPDCTHFSQAKGGQPRNGKIRSLSWVGVRWGGQVRPRCISLENVKQLRSWGPLIAKRDPETSRVVTLEMVTCPQTGRQINRVADPGERVPVQNQFLVPDPKKAGRTWKRFLSILTNMGYVVEHDLLVAADYGAPTTRERLFGFARCDGDPIVWPEPTHFKNPKPGQKKWRSAADCIDWSIPCPSIYGRKKPLADATMRRIARGLKRYVLDAAEPFIVPATHHGADRGHGNTDPIPTVTAAHRGELMAVSPTIVQCANATSNGIADAGLPLGVITAWPKGGSHALVAPTLLKIRGSSDGGRLDLPLPVITSGAGAKRPAGAAHAMGVVAASIIQAAHGEGSGPTKRRGSGAHDVKAPLGTVPAGGNSFGAVTHSMVRVAHSDLAASHLMVNTTGHAGAEASDPIPTVTTGGHHTIVSAFLAQQNTMPNGAVHAGHDAREPVSTIIGSGSHQNVVAASLATLRGTNTGRGADEPLRTASAGGEHHAVIEYTLSPDQEEGALRVAAFLMRYYGEGGQWGDLRDPAATLTTKDRLALVTVWLHGHPYVIVDIGLRMLTPRELYRAQGFPETYQIEVGHDGRKFSKSQQVQMVGNSVSPPPAVALLRANHSRTPLRAAA